MMNDSFIPHAFKWAEQHLAFISHCESNTTELLKENELSALFFTLTCQRLDKKERIEFEENLNSSYYW